MFLTLNSTGDQFSEPYDFQVVKWRYYLERQGDGSREADGASFAAVIFRSSMLSAI
jgi:hypothetical protein